MNFVIRYLKISDLSGVITRAGITSSVVLLLVGAAMAFKTVVSLSHAPEQLAAFILGLFCWPKRPRRSLKRSCLTQHPSTNWCGNRSPVCLNNSLF